MPSTHPIDATCRDNEEAQGLLDGIAYGKGAVFLNQIINSIGETTFFNGCKAYFKKFGWQNTELKDFIGCLSDSLNSDQGEKPEFDLMEFTELWLNHSGCNSVVS